MGHFRRVVTLRSLVILGFLLISIVLFAGERKPKFRVIGFYTGRNDPAHISFVYEANKWLAETAQKYHFSYVSTTNWDSLNLKFLAKYDVVLFLDTRPEKGEQRIAFENYMKGGGAWIGFHFAAFALTPSGYPQNWDWYHNEFLGSGQYKGNTWRPTSAILHIEQPGHPVTGNLPDNFKASPNEWYSWQNDLRKNHDITVLLSIDPASFPLGTGPKTREIWHEGDYPVAWTNKKYRMVYFNMGHNDLDYEGRTNMELSHTFDNPVQDKLIINALEWLGGR